jgi:phasin family protein
MMKSFDDFQKFGKDGVDATMESLSAASKGFQALAVESAEYARKSFEDSTAAVEKLFGARTLERAIEVQSDYAKTAYEGFVAQATKLGEIYADIAKQSYKPIEGYATKFNPTA